jgi:hypothetical protein
MTMMEKIAVLLALTFAFTTAVLSVVHAVLSVVHTDRALAYTTVITHDDQAVGGCGGQGC